MKKEVSMFAQSEKVPTKAWICTFAGTAINLCLGILYAWSIWKKALVGGEAGTAMTGINEGWIYLTNAEASTPFSLCVITFALFMIPGGRIQDKYSPKLGATIGGLFLAAGCIIAGLMKSYTGLILGFGLLGGIGMGIGYAAPTPAALKWFGKHRRGLIAGIVVAGYGGAAIYIGFLAEYLITHFGITGSLVGLGLFFALVVIVAGQLLYSPPEGYVAPSAPAVETSEQTTISDDTNEVQENWSPGEMLKTWQYYALFILFMFNTQSGLLIIANAAGLLKQAAADVPFLAMNAWILVSFGGIVNAAGRVGTGMYSDKIGRLKAYCINCAISAVCLFMLPYVIASGNIILLFIVVGIAYWQYGGGLSLLPSFTADFFGPKNLGINYGLIFVGWGCGFFMAKVGGAIEDIFHNLNYAFYISGSLLIVGILLASITKKPTKS